MRIGATELLILFVIAAIAVVALIVYAVKLAKRHVRAREREAGSERNGGSS